MSFTRLQIIEAIAEKTSVEKKTAEAMLDCLAQLAYEHAKDEFTLPGIGKLVLVDRKARVGRNPSVVCRKWLDILSPLFALFLLGPTWFYPFEPLACPFDFSHYLLDCRRPHERSGCFVPRLQELFNGLL